MDGVARRRVGQRDPHRGAGAEGAGRPNGGASRRAFVSGVTTGEGGGRQTSPSWCLPGGSAREAKPWNESRADGSGGPPSLPLVHW